MPSSVAQSSSSTSLLATKTASATTAVTASSATTATTASTTNTSSGTATATAVASPSKNIRRERRRQRVLNQARAGQSKKKHSQHKKKHKKHQRRPSDSSQSSFNSNNNIIMSRHPFQWPSSLAVELQTMQQAEFLANLLQKLITVARSEIVEGLAVDPSNGQLFLRSLTQEQLLLILEENQDILQKQWQNDSSSNTKAETLQAQLQSLVSSGTHTGARSLVAWDDDVSPKTPISFVVVKDDREKRLTLVLLDTETSHDNNNSTSSPGCLAPIIPNATTTWPLPASIVNQMPVDTVGIHPTYHQAVYGGDDDDNTNTPTLYHRIAKTALKPLFQMYQKYKLYVTGHGTNAAAAATLVAFTLATAPTTPKPVSCLTTCTPRVGNHEYLQVASQLEALRFLRTARIVLEGDACTPAASCAWGLCHAGFQIELLHKPKASSTTINKSTTDKTASGGGDDTEEQEVLIDVTYPKLEDTCWNRWQRAWRNAQGSSAAISSQDYAQAILEHKEALEGCDLNELYADQEYTGYEIAPLPVEK